MSERPEARKRRNLIDQQLEKNGWKAGKPGLVAALQLAVSGLSVNEPLG